MSQPLEWVRYPDAPADFLHTLPTGIAPLIGQLLWNRKITHADEIVEFLEPCYGDLHDAFRLRGMKAAVDRIRRAIEQGERVGLYGDYDTDGVTATVLLRQVLTSLGLEVLPYIPKRLVEGYGLNMGAVEQLAQQVKLLITVDCGIKSVDEVARAQALGLDVIVLDHHEPGPHVPAAYAVVNPKQPGCSYPYKQLAAVGVAFKLVQALHREGLRSPYTARALLDVVALGTVADVVPLDGENRVLVKLGLQAINATERVGLKALIEAAAIRGAVTCHSIGFHLSPRINAAGRLADAIQAHDLLLCTDAGRARTLAEDLNALNVQRQVLTKRVQQAAHEMALQSGKADQRILVLYSDGFPQGIVGLVAARLVESFGRPVLLLEQGETMSRGSARSIPGFSIVAALAECAEVFEQHGGHAMAAGFTIRNERLNDLEARLAKIAERDLTAALLVPKLHYDAELPLHRLSCALVDQVKQLEPFGNGNPEPVWVTRGVRVGEVRTVGSESQHLKLRVHDGRGMSVDAMAWRQGQRIDEFRNGPRVDLAYTLEINEWRDRRNVQMVLKDMRVASH